MISSALVNIRPSPEAFLGVRASGYDIDHVVAQQGVISRRHHPGLTGTLDRMVRTGELVAVLPGVYAPTAYAGSFETRVRALSCARPDAILTGAAAAKVSYWPRIRCDEVTCCLPYSVGTRAGYRFERRRIDDELVCDGAGLRSTSPALTVLDLTSAMGGDAIDHALRTRATTLALLHRALELTPRRGGNRQRRRLLLESRDEPWSAAERLFHRLLHEARITGWRANRPTRIRGRLYFLDVAWARLKLVVEIDGRLHQDDAAVFETDRWRQNALVLDGWRVLRFTWRMLQERPEAVIAAIRVALKDLPR